MIEEIYNLRNDIKRIIAIQEASKNKISQFGFKIENNVLFGTNEWFDLVNQGVINKFIIKGEITNIFLSGHNDFPEFEIQNKTGKSIWPRFGDLTKYSIGGIFEIIYVEQKFKRPIGYVGTKSKCIIEIMRISDMKFKIR